MVILNQRHQVYIQQHKEKFMNDEYELRWIHEGDALVSLMLLEGFKYIMCEIGEEDKQYLDDNEEPPRFIVEKDEEGCFVDVNGNMWQHAQAINNDGTVMTYDDYLMLKQLKEIGNDK